MSVALAFHAGLSEMQRCCLGAALLVAFGPAGQLLAQQSDVAFINNLREQEAYRQIDEYCRKRLLAKELSDATAVDITVAWLRASTQQALEAPIHERKTYWKQLKEIVASSQRVRRSPRGILIPIQLVLSELARAEVTLQETFGELPVEDRLKTIRLNLRKIIGELRSIDTSLEELLRSIYKKSASEARASGWTKTELESLRRNLAVQLARSYRNQAISYPVDSPDRINSLGLALQSLANLTKSSSMEHVVWRARMEQLVCLRLLKRFVDARQLLEQWQNAEPSPEFALWLVDETVRLAAAEVNPDPLPHASNDENRPSAAPRPPAAVVHEDGQRKEADALAASGEREKALGIYRRLLELHAENGEIHEAYAMLLSQGKMKEDLRAALQAWRRIEKRSKPAGPRWLRARQARLELLKRLGKGEQAEKLWQLTKVLYPQTVASLKAPLPQQTP